jgi:hypothetical protein
MTHEIERGIVDLQGLIAEIESINTTHLRADIEIKTVQTQETVKGTGKDLGQMRDTEDTTDQGLDLKKKAEGGGSHQRDKCLLSLEIFTKVES